MNSLFIRVLRAWLPIAVAVSSLTFIIYLVIQQDIRISANDPQIQIAEDTANSLNSGSQIKLSEKIDISKSLSTFTTLYDQDMKVSTSSAILDGTTPSIPQGVLSSAKQKGENRITWQPKNGVRIASVVVPYNKGFVLVGRNMREIETREDQQFSNVILGWIISLVATFSCVVFIETIFKKK